MVRWFWEHPRKSLGRLRLPNAPRSRNRPSVTRRTRRIVSSTRSTSPRPKANTCFGNKAPRKTKSAARLFANDRAEVAIELFLVDRHVADAAQRVAGAVQEVGAFLRLADHFREL